MTTISAAGYTPAATTGPIRWVNLRRGGLAALDPAGGVIVAVQPRHRRPGSDAAAAGARRALTSTPPPRSARTHVGRLAL